MRCVAGCAHMRGCIAGAASTGPFAQSASAVTTSSARPCARRASTSAVAGTIAIASARARDRRGSRRRSADPTCPSPPLRPRARESVSGPRKRCADAVITGKTSPPPSREPRDVRGLVRGDAAGDAEGDRLRWRAPDPRLKALVTGLGLSPGGESSSTAAAGLLAPVHAPWRTPRAPSSRACRSARRPATRRCRRPSRRPSRAGSRVRPLRDHQVLVGDVLGVLVVVRRSTSDRARRCRRARSASSAGTRPACARARRTRRRARCGSA